jgi:hypothetical protein
MLFEDIIIRKVVLFEEVIRKVLLLGDNQESNIV